MNALPSLLAILCLVTLCLCQAPINMSFKRVADDFDDFKLQKKRRVNDLLLESVPCDEAILVKNGKLACLVCSHRPVFDTTAMLSIHRKGKKHLANSLIKLERAREDAEIRQKRQQESFLKTRQDIPKNPLLGLTQMKKDQALNESSGSSQTHSLISGSASGLNGNRDTNEPFFGKKSNLDLEKSSCSPASCCVTRKSSGSRDTFFEITKKNNPKREKFLSVNPLTKQKIDLQESKNPAFHGKNVEVGKLKQSTSKSIVGGSKTSDPSVHNRANSSTFFSHDQHTTLTNLDTNSKALYLSKLRQMGWILGTDGKWEKDENAEFESDEDEPPSPRSILFG